MMESYTRSASQGVARPEDTASVESYDQRKEALTNCSVGHGGQRVNRTEYLTWMMHVRCPGKPYVTSSLLRDHALPMKDRPLCVEFQSLVTSERRRVRK
jgi:hypothetical protein